MMLTCDAEYPLYDPAIELVTGRTVSDSQPTEHTDKETKMYIKNRLINNYIGKRRDKCSKNTTDTKDKLRIAPTN